jgi:hypothetical protein
MLIRSFVTIALTAINVASAAGQILPSPPQNLTHVVDGTTVTLTWTAATGAAGYVVEASVIPGGPVVASLPIATPTLTVPNVPQGVYYVRVRAVSGGLQSPPSNEVVVAVTGGCPAPPLPPRLIVRAAGLDVTLGWGSSGGCAPTSYVVLAGSGPGLSDIAQVNAGGQLGLSAVAPAGTYYIRVVGTNSFGSASSEEMIARVAVNNVTDTIQPLNALFFDITLTQTGSYLATLVWNDASIDLDLYLATAGCPYPPTGCTLAISDQNGVNTEVVSLPVRAGEVYRLWVDNFTNRTTSFTISNVVAPGVTAIGGADEGRAAVGKTKIIHK